MQQKHLIDQVADDLRLDYISDLHFLDNNPRRKLLVVLENSGDYPVGEWIDACEYIAGRKCFSGKEAREILFQYAGRKKGQRIQKIVLPKIRLNLGRFSFGS